MLLFYIEAALCFIFTLYLYFRYAMKHVRYYIPFLVITVWFLTFVTASVKSAKSGEDSDEIQKEVYFFQVLYLIVYWLIYILSWVVIPVAQEYEKAGDFSGKARLKRAIRTNIYIYLIFLIGGIIFIMYLIVKQQLTGQKLIAFLIALSNAWGIFLSIFLLGYGLVAVPKNILKHSDYKTRIKYLEYYAADTKEILEERNIDLINCAHKIKSVRSILDSENSNGTTNPNRGFIEKIWLDDEIVEEELKTYSKKFSYDELTQLNMDIKRNKYDIIKLKAELEDIYKEWFHLQTLQGNIPNAVNWDKNSWTKFLKLYYITLKPWLLRGIALMIIILSLATVLSEITLFTNLPLSIFGLLIEQSNNIYMLNLLCLIPLIFMFMTSLYGLFHLKVYGYYSMHDNRQTDSDSLLFLSSFMCRIGFPLCLNFVQIIKLQHVKTNIEWIMGETPDFGRNFMLFFPATLIVLCLFNIFDIYGRFLNVLGFNTFGFKSQQNDDKIEEGNEIMNKMRFTHDRDNRNDEICKKNDLISNLIPSKDETEIKLTPKIYKY